MLEIAHGVVFVISWKEDLGGENLHNFDVIEKQKYFLLSNTDFHSPFNRHISSCPNDP